MNRQGLLSDRAKRRRQGLPPELRPAKLEDMSATDRNYIGADWVTSDITLTPTPTRRRSRPAAAFPT